VSPGETLPLEIVRIEAKGRTPMFRLTWEDAKEKNEGARAIAEAAGLGRRDQGGEKGTLHPYVGSQPSRKDVRKTDGRKRHPCRK